jgi:hypothetical protein
LRSYEVNKAIEARGLETRYRGKREGGVRIERRVRIEIRIEVSVKIRVKIRTEVEWVLSIYLVEMNK